MVQPASAALGSAPGGGGTVTTGVTLSGEWDFDDNVAMADPGNRDLRMDNATLANVTQIAIDHTTKDGSDASNLLGLLDTDDKLYIQRKTTTDHFIATVVSVVNNGSWSLITVAHEASGGSFSNNDKLVIVFMVGGADHPASSPPLYDTVVTNSVELIAALTSASGSTFIKSGQYILDTDVALVVDTTPRKFEAASRTGDTPPIGAADGVSIEFIGAGGAWTELDFSASLTEAEGVEFHNLNLFSSSASLLAFFVGLFGGSNLNGDGGSVLATAFSGCRNLIRCTHINPGAGGIGFFGCTGLILCSVGTLTAGEGAQTGFFICTDLTACAVFYEAGTTGAAFAAGFQFCNGMNYCFVDMTLVTAIVVAAFGAVGCLDMTNFEYAGPTVGGIAALVAIDTSERVNGALVSHAGVNVNLCDQISNITSTQGVPAAAAAQHFVGCTDMKGCKADGAEDSGDPASTDIFEDCEDMVACTAESATGDSYVDCKGVSSSRSITPTGVDVSGTTTERICPHTNNFQYVLSPAVLTADVDDYAGTAGASVVRVGSDSSGPWIVSGLAPADGSHIARIVRIVNVSAFSVILGNQDTGSAAANRIITGTGFDLCIPPDGVVELLYDLITSRFRVTKRSMVPNGLFGDMSDGDHTTTGDETPTRDMHYNNLIVSSGDDFIVNGFRIFCRLLTIISTGRIRIDGTDGTAGAPGAAGLGGAAGPGGAARPSGQAGGGSLAGGVGGLGGDQGVPGMPGTAVAGGVPHAGGDGGDSGDGGGPTGGGGAAAPTLVERRVGSANPSFVDATLGIIRGGLSGSGGGSGEGGAVTGGGGGGGGGGAGGNIGEIWAMEFNNGGAIFGVGGAGGAGGDGQAPDAGAGGGAGGGGGAALFLAYYILHNEGTIDLSGGAAGSAGSGFGGPPAGAGVAGLDGPKYTYDVAAETITRAV